MFKKILLVKILFMLLCISGMSQTAYQPNLSRKDTGAARISYNSKELLNQLKPFIGDWYAVPDSVILAEFPEMADAIGFKFEWASEKRYALKFYEGVRERDIDKAILDCTLTGNPRTGEIEFQGYQSLNNYLYKGKVFVHQTKSGFTRQYEVYYPHGTKFKLKEDEEKGMKTYRDVCHLVGTDSLECITEQLESGKWKSWGRGKPYLLTKKPMKGAQIPEWVLSHWEEMTQGTGVWITDNWEYKYEQEPYDAYGLKWEYGLGNKHLKGRLYCIKEDQDVGAMWQFTEYWDPMTAKLRVIQVGGDGTVGTGDLQLTEEGKIKEKQHFVSPGGGAFVSGHEAWVEDNQHHTQSFNIVDEMWEKRRYYVWELEEAKKVETPEEYKELSYLIGTWESSFGENKGRMTYSWGENKRTIRYDNQFKQGKSTAWVKENEGIITYNGIQKKPVFITSYSSPGSSIMAEGSFTFGSHGVMYREFSCHYAEGAGLPWRNGIKAPEGGQTIQFKQIWNPLDENTFEGEFLWYKDGKWEHPIKHKGEKFLWKRIK